MQVLPFVLGALLVAFVVVDILWTAMGEGAGPMTGRVTSGLWKLALSIHRHFGRHRLLTVLGIAVFLTAIALWIVLLWSGWALVFGSGVANVVHGKSGLPAEGWSIAYFTGYTIFTLGIGDYTPVGSFWQVLTALASGTGLFVVTFAITYLVPVVQAATQKRQLAVFLASLGRTPQAMVLNAWEDGDAGALDDHLPSIATNLVMLEQRHLTYPVLHYFHSLDARESVVLGVAALDEALTILELGLPDLGGVSKVHFRTVRQVCTEFLETLGSAFIHPAADPPPAPDLRPLSKAGLPVVSDAVFDARLQDLRERRCLLLGLVQNDGWEWGLIVHEDEGWPEQRPKPEEKQPASQGRGG